MSRSILVVTEHRQTHFSWLFLFPWLTFPWPLLPVNSLTFPGFQGSPGEWPPWQQYWAEMTQDCQTMLIASGGCRICQRGGRPWRLQVVWRRPQWGTGADGDLGAVAVLHWLCTPSLAQCNNYCRQFYTGAGDAIAPPVFWLCTPSMAQCSNYCHHE